eukprot:365900-Chlamydomonas_euryale.AAC.7
MNCSFAPACRTSGWLVKGHWTCPRARPASLHASAHSQSSGGAQSWFRPGPSGSWQAYLLVCGPARAHMVQMSSASLP